MFTFNAAGAPAYPMFHYFTGTHETWDIGEYTVSVLQETLPGDKSLGGYRWEFALLKNGELQPLPKRYGGDTAYRTNAEGDISHFLHMVYQRHKKEQGGGK